MISAKCLFLLARVINIMSQLHAKGLIADAREGSEVSDEWKCSYEKHYLKEKVM
ncbi:MAG TPA: hypothetical protein PK358_05700 [Spirochaetota bacterium]|nr:hypothetical protein [Spirochaetota bacterium]HPJ34309.1 hypothetical protein [Spirochaetota bacterium]